MKKKEYIDHNVTLIFDFLREAVKDPSVLDNIKNGSTIEFIEKDRPVPQTTKTTKPSKYFKVKHRFEDTVDESIHTDNNG